MVSPLRQQFVPGQQPTPVISQFNPLAAGRKAYGGGRPYPNQGKTPNMAGYGIRDAQREVRMAALKRMI